MVSQRCKRGARTGAVATLALALVLACALVAAPHAALADEADAAAADAAEAVSEGEFFVTIDEPGAFAYYSFTAPEDGYYSFSAQGDFDTYAYLYDAEWNLVAEDDDSGTDGSYNACVEVALYAGETCYVAFGFYDAEQTGSYVVALESAPLGELTTDAAVESGITEGGGYAYFAFTPAETGVYAISTSGDSDTYMVLCDSEWYMIGYDDDSGEDFNARVVALLEADQTYYVAVCLYYSDEAGDFSVAAEPIEVEAIATGASVAVSLDAGDSVYYQFTAEEAGVYVFYTAGEGDTFVYAYDEYGSMVGYDDDSGEDENARMVLTLATGETCLLQFSYYFDDDSGEFAVTAEQVEMTEFDAAGENVVAVGESDATTYYTFTPAESGMYSFTLTSVGGYVALDIYDAAWEELGGLTLGEIEYDWTYYYDDDEDYDYDDYSLDEGDEAVVDASLTLAVQIEPLDDGGGDDADDADDEGDSSTIVVTLQASETYIIAVGYDEDDQPESLSASVEAFEVGEFDASAEVAVSLADLYDVEYYTFTPTETALYTFTTAGDADSYIGLYDAEWGIIAYDDDSAEDYNATVSAVLEAGQTYYLEFMLAYYDDVTDFTVTTEQTALVAFDATAENAAVVDESGAVTYFVYTAEQTGPVVLVLSGAGDEGFSGSLCVYDAAGEFEADAAFAVTAGEATSDELFVMLEAGETYVFELEYEGGTPSSLSLSLAAVEFVAVGEDGYTVTYDSASGMAVVYLTYTAATTGVYDFTLSAAAEGEAFAYALVADSEWGYLGYALVDVDETTETVSAVDVVLQEGETCLIELYVYSFDESAAELTLVVGAVETTDVAEAVAAGVPEDATDDAAEDAAEGTIDDAAVVVS